ncbi:MAG: FHA domain-containing protein [Anaerolineales bacterium]
MATSFVLTIKAGPTPGQQSGLEGRSFLMGRDPSCDLVLNDVEVSRRHARLIAQSGGYAIEDLGSTNGTYVNEQRIKTVVPLQPGATIRLGDHVTLLYEAVSADEADTRSLPADQDLPVAPIHPPSSVPEAAEQTPAPVIRPAAGESELPEAPPSSVRRRERRKGLRLPVFSQPWMLGVVALVILGLCMVVFLFIVDVFNLWCSWFGWALSACA